MKNNIIKTTSKTPIEVALKVNKNGMTSAKALYDFLELNSAHYSRWIKQNIEENPFINKNEFSPLMVKTSEKGGRPTKDYLITSNLAKKLAMASNSSKGEEARDYFIKCEKALVKVVETINKPKSEDEIVLQALSILQNRVNEQQKQIEEQEQTIERREEQLLNQAPSVAFSESYNGAEGYIQATQFAKALNSVGIKKLPNGKNIGRNNLLNWLRDSGYVNNDYQPYQRYIKYFGTKQNIYKDPNTDESKVGKPTLLISFKGQQYFIKKFGYKDFLIKYDMLDKNLL